MLSIKIKARNFKHFYLDYVKQHWHGAFPGLPGYQRFVEWTPSTLIPLCAYLKHCFGDCTGIGFVDATSLKVCHNRRIKRHKVFDGLAERGKTSVGRKPSISEEVQEKLSQELSHPEGFDSYQEIQQWLYSVYDVEASYWTVHKTIRYRLKSKLKVPRPVNLKQELEAVEEFKKNCQS